MEGEGVPKFNPSPVHGFSEPDDVYVFVSHTLLKIGIEVSQSGIVGDKDSWS